MSKKIDALISEVRESTENEEFSTEIGLTDEEIIKYFNDAQYRLHAKIIAQHPSVFTEEYTYNVTANQEAYNIPFEAHLGNRITKVEFSSTGNVNDYYPLRAKQDYHRNQGYEGTPQYYIRRNGKIYILPQPNSSTGLLRITYVRRPIALDKTRFLISDATPALTGGDVWTVSAVNSSTIDIAELQKHNRLTVVDAQGNIKAKNVLFSSSTTTSITIDSSYTSESGETVAQNNYVVPRPYATNWLEFNPELERYLQAYVNWKILKRDSSVDSAEAVQELIQMENDIIDSYADIDGEDIYEIPEINDTYWEL